MKANPNKRQPCRLCGTWYPVTPQHFTLMNPYKSRSNSLSEICVFCAETEEDRIRKNHMWAHQREVQRRSEQQQDRFLKYLNGVKRERTNVVYFVQRRRLIKIGHTNNISQRLEALQKKSRLPLQLLGVVPGEYRQEYAIHRQFAHLRKCGEWFAADPELLGWILNNAQLL